MKRTLAMVVALALVACGGSSATEEESEAGTPESPPASTSGGLPGPTSPPGPGSNPDPTDPPPPGATDAGTDAMPDAPPPPVTPGAGAFAGAPAYVATLGPSTLDTRGQGQGHLSYNAQGNPAGRNCLSCHTGAGKAPAFVFGGTIYADAAGTKVVARAEVRMVGPDGKGASAYTDDNGNYFLRASAATIASPAIAGVRNATVTRLMTNKINNGDCNSCHGMTSRITL